MVMRQLYYTSCTKGTGAGSGFQVKALTPGMPQTGKDVFNKSLGYRIPPGMSPEDVGAHPVALRYQCLDDVSCALLCSQSNGPDDAGRPGNFFAHCVLTAPQDFAFYPPVMYWGHPFWRREDASDRLDIDPVPSFDMEPSMAFEQVWAFLAGERRREWLTGLLSAVLRFGEDRRPVVIIDSADNVAMWVAAVTFALPAGFRPFLSFATYHHDPYQVPFLITGTTPDSRFRATADEYESYFVMNVPQGRTSAVKPSEYASRACAGMHEASYEDELVEFLAFCGDHAGPPRAGFGGRLDEAARLFGVVREHAGRLDDPSVRQTVAAYLERLEQGPEVPMEVLSDLDTIGDLCCDALLSSGDREAAGLYARVVRLFARHDPDFASRRASIMDLLALLVSREDEAGVAALSSVVGGLNADSGFSKLACEQRFVQSLTAGWPHQGNLACKLTWSHVVPLVAGDGQASAALASIVAATVRVLDRPTPDASMREAQASVMRPESIVASVLRFTGSKSALELGLGQAAAAGLHGGFRRVYYELVRTLDAKERQACRTRLSRMSTALPVAHLVAIEASREFAVRTDDEFFQRLEEFLDPEVLTADLRQATIDAAVRQYWSGVDRRDRVAASGRLLRSAWLAGQISAPTASELVLTLFCDPRMRALDAAEFELAERYLRHPALTSNTNGALQGQIAMTMGKFAPGSAGEIRNRLASLNPEAYAREAAALIGRFFEKDIQVAGHVDMLKATYVHARQAEFWDAYWKAFRSRALVPDGGLPMVDVLSFWFDSSLTVFDEQPYLGAAFFMRLPGILRSLSEEKGARGFFAEIETRGAKLAWYPLVKSTSVPAKRGFFSTLGR